MLYNLQFIQALATLSSKFSPDERQAWSTTGALKKVKQGFKLEFVQSCVQVVAEVGSIFWYHPYGGVLSTRPKSITVTLINWMFYRYSGII